MKKLLSNYTSIFYYLITFTLSGILITVHIVFPNLGKYSLSVPQMAPTLTVLIIAGITQNKSIRDNIYQKFFFSVKLLKWIPVIILSITAFVIITASCLSAQGISYQAWNGTVGYYILSILCILIGATCEEIGWRGFWLPLLFEKYSPFKSAVIVGLFWGIWHMNFNLGFIGYFAYILFTTLLSIIIMIVFLLSDFSLYLMILCHFMINLIMSIFLCNRISADCFIAIDICLAVICLATAYGTRKRIFSKTTSSKSK